jgi:hypothetical protein
MSAAPHWRPLLRHQYPDPLGFGNPTRIQFSVLDDYRQATEWNAHVRKGEKGSLVMYANAVTKTEQNDAGEDVEREIRFLKAYTLS